MKESSVASHKHHTNCFTALLTRKGDNAFKSKTPGLCSLRLVDLDSFFGCLEDSFVVGESPEAALSANHSFCYCHPQPSLTPVTLVLVALIYQIMRN